MVTAEVLGLTNLLRNLPEVRLPGPVSLPFLSVQCCSRGRAGGIALAGRVTAETGGVGGAGSTLALGGASVLTAAVVGLASSTGSVTLLDTAGGCECAQPIKEVRTIRIK